jgi:hypothetical protein
MKISPVGAELFHADGQHDAANSSFSQFCERASQQEIKQENKDNGNKEETSSTIKPITARSPDRRVADLLAYVFCMGGWKLNFRHCNTCTAVRPHESSV